MPKRVLTKRPKEIGLSAINLKTLATRTSGAIAIRAGHAVKLIMKGTVTGTPTQGAMSVDIELYDEVKGTATLIHSVVNLTGAVDLTDVGIGATAGALEEVIVFGGGVSSSYRGGGTLSADVDLLQTLGDYIKVKVTVDTASDATTHTLDVYAQVQE